MKQILHSLRDSEADVCGAIAGWLQARPSLRTVASFVPLPGEPDLTRLSEQVPGRTWCFPRVIDDQHLAFHQADDITTFRKSAYGVREPAPEFPEISVAAIDVFLCPGLAFAWDGGRLGRGSGYYDRLLAGARGDALKLGSCFALQLVDTTFSEPHDVRMDVVICELGPLTSPA